MPAPTPTVTIAMPVYNGGSELRLAVQSIIDQSLTEWELIIIDDGSSDGFVAALGLGLDPRIRILSDGKNKGLAARLNEIINLAQAPFMARMDHDDIAHPERLARQVQFLRQHTEIDLVAARCFTMSETREIVGELPFAETHDEICRHPWLGFYMAHPTWMARTSWFRRHHYASPAPYCCEDQELLLRARRTSRYHALGEPLLAYRVRSKVKFRKLFRTRAAWVAVQIRRFALERNIGDLLLASLAFAGRVVADGAREIFPRVRSDLRPLRNGDVSAWNDLIGRALDRIAASTVGGRR